ncbi:type II toxin-antitoxin system VapC family toxin [Streptomyces kebangsaanensis]|uniref:Type II toxin-antitoxin system VapC family toxin n=1 Tax=Streptomyces kebangsaanensis TaxID=864058 RepID=A0ABW6KJN3_9ACTN|nr:type II toxin-antitoxin system VapC family toxin [Streptomyces kebangsaanensis]
MRPVVLDTDTASLIIKKRLPITLATKLVNTQPIITFVTRAELTKWAEVRHWGTGNRRLLAGWLGQVPMLPGDEDVADTYGELSAAAMLRGRPRPMNDMWIAACCLTHDLPLATLNVKDFDDFKAQHGLEIITA